MKQFKHKVGDIICFVTDIYGGYSLSHQILIPKYVPVRVCSITKDHITVLYGDVKYRFRNIPKRTSPAGELAESLFGA